MEVAQPLTVNDVHSQLNETVVAGVLHAASVDDVLGAVSRAKRERLPLAIAGGRHAMGGQQFCAGGLLLDTRELNRVLAFDREGGTIEVEAGIQWPALLAYLNAEQDGEHPAWTFRQKQTGADRLSLGGALAANVHGRGLAFKPLVEDVESFTLVDARGNVVSCSRDRHPELFRLAIGGYGLFGVITSIRLRLVPRRKLERVVEVRQVDGLIEAFEERIGAGFLYGDFQFAIDPSDDSFLRTGIFSCYRPVDDSTAMPSALRALTTEDWKRLLYLTHVDKADAWARYSAHYLATSGQVYVSDAHQFAEYIDDYHRWLDGLTGATDRATEMITEIYVPRERLEDFLVDVAADFRAAGVNLIYGTIRLVEAEAETFLPWARESWACTIFNLHTAHTRRGLEDAATAFRRLIDRAIERGGTYFLTYHRWATREQLETCYPEFPAFLAEKRAHDPDEIFQSEWYRHYARLFA